MGGEAASGDKRKLSEQVAEERVAEDRSAPRSADTRRREADKNNRNDRFHRTDECSPDIDNGEAHSRPHRKEAADEESHS